MSGLKQSLIDTDGPVPDNVSADRPVVCNVPREVCDKSLFGQSLSLASWCSRLVTAVFETRTSFSVFARKSIHLTRDKQVSTSPAFPIPLPFIGAFDRMPSGLSCRNRSRIHFRRAVVLIVLALNFWWSGSRFIDLSLLKRSPSVGQQSIIRRVVDLLQVDGPKIPFDVSLAGRRCPQLVARLAELSEALTSAGVRSSPYDRTFEGREVEVPTKNDVLPELEPYRSLDADRLRIVGQGHFDPLPFLEDNLSMAYTNPDCLLHDPSLEGVELPRINDPLEQVVKLAKIWDAKGLLCLHRFNTPLHYPHECIRVFNCYKSSVCDRQIGDRRGRNFVEMKLEGPSKRLPSGPDVFDLFMKPTSERVLVSVSDRRDFYHQFSTTFSRALSNTLGPGIPESMLKDTQAFSALMLRDNRRPKDRLRIGDGLFSSPRFPPHPDGGNHVFVAFKSILQGDHGGVEFACQSHEGLLASGGLLDPSERVIADHPFRGDKLMQGLVIDDFFAVSVVPKGATEKSPDAVCFDKANKIYNRYDLIGSPDKDVVSEPKAKVIGACINSSDRALSKGLCTLGSPAQKRYALSWITLQVCALAFTTDVLHLCLLGGWVAILTFRRPLMSILNESFRLVDASSVSSTSPKIIRLPRAVANELTLLALMCCLAVSNLGAEASDRVYATDASLSKGGICSAPVEESFSRFLWRISRSKGAYHRLLTPIQALARRLGVIEETGNLPVPLVQRPLAFRYDFIEIFSGASKVTLAVAALGLVCGPPIDLSISCEYNMEWVHVVSWISYMVASHRLLAFMCEPPCTSFSLMRRPALRSKFCPFGFCTANLQTKLGNLLAHRSLQLLSLARTNGVVGLLETPFSALTKHLPAFKSILTHSEVSMCRSDSCMFGSIHMKPFRFVGVNVNLQPVQVRCDRSHTHVLIQGSFTKTSATYSDRLAECLAVVVKEGVDSVKARFGFFQEYECGGLENQALNSVVLSSQWSLDKSWTFKKKAHINVLEFSVLEKVALHQLSLGGDRRVVSMADSFVVSAAASKGRTSSYSLASVLRRYNALCVAGGLYINVPFIPTRLNIADDPTREVPLRSSSGSFDLASWPASSWYSVSSLPKLRRWSSNWVRLVLSLLGPEVLRVSDRSVYRQSWPLLGFTSLQKNAFDSLDFDSTLGYPGEGPPLLCLLFCLLVFMPCCVGGVSTSAAHFAMAMTLTQAMMPRNAADISRQQRRLSRPPLPRGRPVLQATSNNRDVLFDAFSRWVLSEGNDIDSLLSAAMGNLDVINRLLERYGQVLYSSGRPYGHFSETINAVVARRPILRRNLQQAWDYAFAWVRAEPPTHHLACPWQVLLAILSTSLLWGWTRVAGIVALCFGGLLRAGEALNACRYDLLLPRDTADTNHFALLAIAEPKTRFSAARHQCSKIDSSDLIQILDLAFGDLPQHARLWPFSGQTLRNRFKAICTSLGLHVLHPGMSPIDLASLRPGGATWLLQATEQSELVRRRGRWVSSKVMEVYLQEVSAARYVNSLSAVQKEKVFGLANGFPSILRKAEVFAASAIPCDIWYRVFQWS